MNGALLEIACDESGYEGDKLIGTTTDVFAHASVLFDIAAATDCMQELRRRIRSPATEYKANHLLRDKHRSVLKWLLGPAGPAQGNAHVFLIDKAYFVLRRVVDLLLGAGDPADAGLSQDEHAEAMAITLYSDGRSAFAPQQWAAFLVSGNNLMRAKYRLDVTTPVDAFFRMVDDLRLANPPSRLDEILVQLGQGRTHAEAFKDRLLADPSMMPAMDPLMPAIVRAVSHWSADGALIAMAHDRQTTLPEERIEQLKQACDDSGSRLARLSLVGSSGDPRIQLADVIAGAVRKIASDELDGRGAELTALLRPYLDPYSIWADERSWTLLRPAGGPAGEPA